MTDKLPEDAPDLPRLTDKQFAYVKAVLQGMTLSDAYRAAYDTSNWTDEAVWVEASTQARNPKVVLWLRAARESQLVDTTITKEWYTRELLRLAKAAEQSGNYGASAMALKTMGQANGMHVDKFEIRDTSKIDMLERINQLPQQFRPMLLAMAGLSESDTDTPTQH